MKKMFLSFAAFLAFFAFSAISTHAQANAANSLASDFSVTTIDGKTYNTANLRGKTVVINLWFVNCPNCLEEIGLLNKLVDEYQSNKDIVFLGLATNNPAQLKSFLQKNSFKYQIVPNSANIMLTQFGTPDKSGQINIPFPMHIVIDRDGKKVLNISGIKGVEAVRSELKKQLSAKTGS